MHYAGGKSLICKKLAPIIRAYRKPGQLYIEPFCGAVSVFKLMDNPRIGGDLNAYIPALWSAVRDGWEPPEEIDEAEYYRIRASMDSYPPELVGYAMVALSYGGNFADIFCKNALGYDYQQSGINSIRKRRPLLQGAEFVAGAYTQFSAVRDALFYCDPPYRNTAQKGYQSTMFDSAAFWDWCRIMAARGNTMIVSEYSATDFAREIAAIPVSKKISMSLKTHQIKIERVYLVGDAEPLYGQQELFT